MNVAARRGRVKAPAQLTAVRRRRLELSLAPTWPLGARTLLADLAAEVGIDLGTMGITVVAGQPDVSRARILRADLCPLPPLDPPDPAILPIAILIPRCVAVPHYAVGPLPPLRRP